ncbi:hypothetical protein DFH11DRAFT_147335 [Phellopilus nigrolimitatus]|nr:hypothetical protein DFH11DRAFT_147335 [Phellopilus nigrolimitatus]
MSSHHNSRPRPRSYTSSLGAFPWRRNKPDAALASSPAAPVQTLPIDTLLQALSPPTAPSLSHARSLAAAFTTQTPAPSSSAIAPIFANLCRVDQPPAIQAAGFDLLAAYCACGAFLATSDRLTFFDVFRETASAWALEVWEPRAKALNALLPSVDDAVGIEKALLAMLTGWVGQAADGLCTSGDDETERAVEVLNEVLTVWSEKLEVLGRISEDEVLSVFEFYRSLVDRALTSPKPEPSPIRHRRHPSSISNVPSPLRPPASRNHVHFISAVYLDFLESRITRLPPSFLPQLMPLLFRVLAAVMSPLAALSARPPATPIDPPTELRVIKIVAAFLKGPYSITSLILLRQLLLPSPSSSNIDVATQIATSLGALRTLRVQIRRVLEDRMAMRVVQRDTAASATHAGTPGDVDAPLLERAQRAWGKDGADVWDARKVGVFLVRAVRAWTACPAPAEKERVFEEVAALLKDVLQEMDERVQDGGETGNGFNDHDTAAAVGRVLFEMTNYVKTLKNDDGTPMNLSLSPAHPAPNPLFRTLAFLFSRTQTKVPLSPPLPLSLLAIASHVPDADAAGLPAQLAAAHQLMPPTPGWLATWELLFACNIPAKPAMRRAVHVQLASVYEKVKDVRSCRRPLVELLFEFWMQRVERAEEGEDAPAVWGLLADEVALRSTEEDSSVDDIPPTTSELTVHKIMVAMMSVSGYCDCDGELDAPAKPANTAPVSPSVPLTPSNTAGVGSPIATRTSQDSPPAPGKEKEKEKEAGSNNMQQIMSSLRTLTGSRHQSQTQVPQLSSSSDESPTPRAEASSPPLPGGSNAPCVPCRGLTAASALLGMFAQLAFADYVMMPSQARLALFVSERLLKLLRTAPCPRVRVAILQLLMRLRADRDHRAFLVRAPAEHEQQIYTLARLVGRLRGVPSTAQSDEAARNDEIFADRARARQTFERNGRRTSSGRGSRTSVTESRSRSRAAGRAAVQPMAPINTKPRDALWGIPDIVPFSLENAEKGSRLLVTYDPQMPSDGVVLPVSDYMDVLVELLKAERDWEVLSYLLVHLPVQLANKHFWCGPRSREAIAGLLVELCKGVLDGTLGRYVPQDEWPGSLKTRDAQSLAYHTLTVLISYQTIFDAPKRHVLVEVFQAGLGGRGETVIVCTHALTLCLFEMETSMVKALPHILQKLAQIVSNPSIAVHMLTFLCILNSLPHMYANFTEEDFKFVFAVALQYLQHHSRAETPREEPFSLSQHVRVMSYSVLYIWFLALKLADRPRHIKFIARQLLLANEGRDDIDEPTEVCFDFLARYTYATADPKPAPSLLGDILARPTGGGGETHLEGVVQEKTWVVGYSIITVRLLAKAGWLEVTTRRASGTTKFLLKSENIPLVDLGDVNPDMFTIPASLMMDKDPRALGAILTPSEISPPPDIPPSKVDQNGELLELFETPEEDGDESRPDPVTGYVWSGSAPSQRRKRVDMDPAFFPLQMSAYPDIRRQIHRGKIVRDTQMLGSTIRTLDRIAVIDTHKVGILYVAPGQKNEVEILSNTRGSPAYTRFLAGLGRLIKIRGQLDVSLGGLDPDEDGEYAYAWWDDTGQVLYHTATMMPNHASDEEHRTFKKRHIGNDHVRIVWNDAGLPYRFDTLKTDFQFVNIVIEPHSRGAIAAYSDNAHEHEYFKLSLQCAEGMSAFAPVGDFKIVSARSLGVLVRQLSLVADWYASIFKDTERDTKRNEIVTNWRARLETIKKFANSIASPFEHLPDEEQGIMGQESFRDFTPGY